MVDLKKAYRIRQYGYQRAEEDRVQRLKALSHEEWLHGLRMVHTVREPDQYLFSVAAKLQTDLIKQDIRFCFIGGLPLQRWGETRFTNDIDLTVICDLGQERLMLEKLRRIVPSRTDDTEQLVLLGRMYLGISSENIEIDISLGYIPYEQRMVERAVEVDFGVDIPLQCCSAEDLIILKTVAARAQDWVDIVRIIQRSGRDVDWELVFGELKTLLDLTETPESLTRLREMVGREM